MNRKGFTLIELVMILVLIGIMAAFAAPRFDSVNTTKAAAFADKLRSDIRYAQNLAMTTSQRHRVFFNAAPAPVPGYAVVNVSTGLIVPDPAGTLSLSVTLGSGDYAGITIAAAPAYIEFDSLGRPWDATGILMPAATTITILPSGSVTITQQTGAAN